MGTPHVHSEVIKAWADGMEIQVRRDVGSPWTLTTSPFWNTSLEYRVKPETIRYRVALFKECTRVYTGIYTTQKMANITESASPYFVRWLTDWVEVEV